MSKQTRPDKLSADPSFRIPDNPACLRAAELRMTIFQLRKAGWTIDQIAKALGMTTGRCRRHYRKELSRYAKVLREDGPDLLAQELERLEEQHRALWPAAMGGNLKAHEYLIRISERRSKMLGLDAPVKIEQKTDLSLSEASDDELLLKAKEAGILIHTLPPRALPHYLPGEEPDPVTDVPDAEVQPTKEVPEGVFPPGDTPEVSAPVEGGDAPGAS